MARPPGPVSDQIQLVITIGYNVCRYISFIFDKTSVYDSLTNKQANKERNNNRTDRQTP
jgi:hypothetical protein